MDLLLSKMRQSGPVMNLLINPNALHPALNVGSERSANTACKRVFSVP